MSKSKLAYCACLVLLTFCKSKNNVDPFISFDPFTSSHIVDIKMSDFKEKEFEWSDIIEKIDVISLETDKTCLVSHINKLQYYDSTFFIMDHEDDHSLIAFDKNGNCKFKLEQGRGPGEFNEIRSFVVKNDTIGTLERYNVMFYDLSGTYLGEHQIGGINMLGWYSNPTDFAITNSFQDEYYIWTGSLGINDFSKPVYAMYHLSNLGEPVAKYFRVSNKMFGGIRFNSGQSILITPTIKSDTIYAVSTEGVYPKYHVDFGKWTLPGTLSNNSKLSQGEVIYKASTEYPNTNILFNSAYESRDHLFFQFLRGGKVYYCIWSIKSSEKYYGKVSVPLRVIGAFSGGFIAYSEAYQLDEITNKESALKINSTLKNINYNDNPVLFLVEIKE